MALQVMEIQVQQISVPGGGEVQQSDSAHPMRTRLRDHIRQPKLRTDGTVPYPTDGRRALVAVAEPTTHTVKLSQMHGGRQPWMTSTMP